MLGRILWDNFNRIAMVFVFVLSCWVIYEIRVKPKTENINIYQSSFDLTKVPVGMVIWSHGVPGTEMDFVNANASARYEFFDIGILTKELVVFQIRVPFYSISMFEIGSPVNYSPIQNKNPLFRNNMNNYYVYKDNEVKKLVNN